jgi:hypothetical protein
VLSTLESRCPVQSSRFRTRLFRKEEEKKEEKMKGYKTILIQT